MHASWARGLGTQAGSTARIGWDTVSAMFFDGFLLDETGPARLRTGGSGPPLLLLHGQPQSHAMWHAVAARLCDRFTLVCPDLSPHRAEADLAADMLALMRGLGHERFGVAGHDLGGHVAARMALDAPARVRRLAVLEIVPVPEHMNRADMAFALAGYPACWFGQLHPKPEALVTHAPADWFRQDMVASGEDVSFFHPEAVADYLRADTRLADPQTNALSSESRAVTPSASETAHRLRLTCPVLVLWGSHGRIGGWYDPLQVWRECGDGMVSGGAIAGGHFLAEEAPDAVAVTLGNFFAEPARPPVAE